VSVAAPTTLAVTRPLGDTVPTVGALEVHATGRPVSVRPLASLSVTISCAALPSGSVHVAGPTTTDAPGTSVTVTAALPVFPSLVAVTVADPAAPPATCSVAPTGGLAVAGVPDTEATGRGPTAPPPFGSVASLARQPREIPAPAAMAIARIQEAGKYFAPGQHRTRTPRDRQQMSHQVDVATAGSTRSS